LAFADSISSGLTIVLILFRFSFADYTVLKRGHILLLHRHTVFFCNRAGIIKICKAFLYPLWQGQVDFCCLSDCSDASISLFLPRLKEASAVHLPLDSCFCLP